MKKKSNPVEATDKHKKISRYMTLLSRLKHKYNSGNLTKEQLNSYEKKLIQKIIRL